MKTLKYLYTFLILSFVVSCNSDDDGEVLVGSELDNFQKVTTISTDVHQIELYTSNGHFQTGFNTIYLQIKNTDGSLIENAEITWNPIMHMENMSHSCPYSSIDKKENAQSTYAGFIVFQMAGHGSEGWELNLDYKVSGAQYSVTAPIDVMNSSHRVVESFQGNDGNNYVLAMTEPKSPIVGINTMQAVLYKMENMMSFVPVENYMIKIDPRMPGMGNHGSPNNVDLTYSSSAFYNGKISLTMTGYWKVNLQLLDSIGELIKGEEVTDDHPSSSVYFEIEF